MGDKIVWGSRCRPTEMGAFFCHLIDDKMAACMWCALVADNGPSLRPEAERGRDATNGAGFNSFGAFSRRGQANPLRHTKGADVVLG